MMSEQTIQFIINNGVAFAVLCAVLYGVYRAGKIILEHVALPLKDAAVKHLEDTSKHLDKTAIHLERNADALDGLRCALDKIDRKIPNPKTDP
jgi:hypothetical protein